MKRNFPNWLVAWCNQFLETEVPHEYALWSGIYVLASVLQDNVSFSYGLRKIYPNLYIWLVSESTSGKSLAGEPAIDLLSQVPNLNCHRGELNKSYLLLQLQRVAFQNLITSQNGTISAPHLVIYSDELVGSIGSGDFAYDLIKKLTEMYTVPAWYDYGTIKHGLIRIERPLLNWLACTAPSWIRRTISPDIIESGFIARINSLCAELPKEPKPKFISFDPGYTDKLLSDLILIQTLSGEYKYSPEAEEEFEKWYAEQFHLRRTIDDETQRALYGKESAHVVKLCMIFMASIGESLIITKQVFQTAAELVITARKSSISVFTEIAALPTVNLKQRVLRLIMKHKIIQRKYLATSLSRSMNAKTLDECLTSLLVEEAIEMDYDETKGGKIYRLKP